LNQDQQLPYTVVDLIDSRKSVDKEAIPNANIHDVSQSEYQFTQPKHEHSSINIMSDADKMPSKASTFRQYCDQNSVNKIVNPNSSALILDMFPVTRSIPERNPTSLGVSCVDPLTSIRLLEQDVAWVQNYSVQSINNENASKISPKVSGTCTQHNDQNVGHSKQKAPVIDNVLLRNQQIIACNNLSRGHSSIVNSTASVNLQLSSFVKAAEKYTLVTNGDFFKSSASSGYESFSDACSASGVTKTVKRIGREARSSIYGNQSAQNVAWRCDTKAWMKSQLKRSTPVLSTPDRRLLLDMFNTLDVQNINCLNGSQLQEALRMCGYHTNAEAVALDMFKSIRKNIDVDVVSPEEFVHLLNVTISPESEVHASSFKSKNHAERFEKTRSSTLKTKVKSNINSIPLHRYSRVDRIISTLNKKSNCPHLSSRFMKIQSATLDQRVKEMLKVSVAEDMKQRAISIVSYPATVLETSRKRFLAESEQNWLSSNNQHK
jgi:hypothetical protein